MADILLCTKSQSLLEHWQESLINVYVNLTHISTKEGLEKCLENKKEPLLVLDGNFFINSKEYVKSILDTNINTKILFLEDCPSFKEGKEFLSFGIKGYGNSRLSSIHLIQAINIIKDDNIWLYPQFIQNLIKEVSLKNKKTVTSLDTLTKKENDIARLVAKGFSNKIIALKCDITEATVKVHLRSIFKKLKINDRLSLALLFQ